MSRNTTPHSTRRPPPHRPWIIVGICAILSVIALLLRSIWDPALTNITIFVCSLVAIISLLWWHFWHSGYGRIGRLVPLFVVVMTSGTLVGLFQVRRWSGDLRPEFAWRWERDPDELLDNDLSGDRVSSPITKRADLRTLTDHDFPRFLGPRCNLTVEGPVLDRDWAVHPPRRVWQKSLGAGWSSFSAVNGYAVTLEQRGPQELVTCCVVATGDPVWQHAIPARHESEWGYVGPRSTPTIHDGRVYVLGATGIVRCLEGTDGTLVWQKNLLAEVGLEQVEAEKFVPWGRSASPLVTDSKLIVPVGGSDDGPRISVIALDLATGEVIWRGGQEQTSYASPIALTLDGAAQIVLVNQDVVTGHDTATGEQLWAHDWPGNSSSNASVSNPVPVGTTEGLKDCVFLSKGYGVGAELIRLSATENGNWSVVSLWKKRRAMKTKMTNVAIRDGFVYGLDEGILSCVELATGQRRWKKGRYGHGQILLVKDLLLIQSERGALDLVTASPDRYQKLGRIQALDGQSWNNLCLHGRYLLMRNSEQAVCYELAVRNGTDE